MNWFRQMSSLNPTAGVSGQDGTGTNDGIFGTSDALPSAQEAGTPPLPGVPGTTRTDEIKRRQLALLETYVAKIRMR
jgi:hypothetical protein